MNGARDKEKRRLGLATKVFIGLGLGIATGIFFGESVSFLSLFGDAFIALLQITVIPYVMVALMTSLGRLTLADVKTLGLKAGSILLVLWVIGLAVVIVSPLAFPDWPSASFFSASQVEGPKPVDFVKLYIPSNIFFSLSQAIVPAIVVFSILFGLALINVKGKERVLDLLTTTADVLMGITGYIGKLAPYGVFAITANAAGTIDVADLGRLEVYIVLYVVLALILSLWVIPGLIAAVTPLRYGAILRTFRLPLITAFATANLLIVLPVLAADGKKLIGQTGDDSDQLTEQEESSVDILIPAAYPFPSLGSVLTLVFVLFGGWYVGSTVSITEYPTLIGAGLASLFGGPVLALPFLFDLLRLPADLFPVFVAVDVISGRLNSLLAAMHVLAIALIGAYAMQGAVVLRPIRLLRFGIVSGMLIAAALIGLRVFYTYVYVQPYSKGRLLAGLELVTKPQPHTVYREAPRGMLKEQGASRSLASLKKSGVLRACYLPDDYPSAFLNTHDELVGFDVEMIHRFASRLGVSIEFLPVASVAAATGRVNSGYCDLVASLFPITPGHTEVFGMTSPVLTAPVSLIVPDHRRNSFRWWASIRDTSGLRIGFADDPDVRSAITRFMPNAIPVPYHDKKELDAALAAGAPGVDAILDTAEEAAVWTIRYPHFMVVTPTPTLHVALGYAVGKGNTDLLTYLDTWLLTAKTDGTIDTLYRYWMLGEVKKTQPPRWSIIRNVLHWID
jgi:Na+/H+-dicarboxylate symporter/ABC-type amino acid transport substrate-binding protein